MIKHIVTWKLTATDDAGKTAAFEEISAALLPLAQSVPSVVSLEVGRNAAYPDTNWDIAIFAEFESIAGLEEYQVHPEHVKAAAVVRANVSERAAIDYEV